MDDPIYKAQNNQHGLGKSVDLEEAFFLNEVLHVVKKFLRRKQDATQPAITKIIEVFQLADSPKGEEFIYKLLEYFDHVRGAALDPENKERSVILRMEREQEIENLLNELIELFGLHQIEIIPSEDLMQD